MFRKKHKNLKAIWSVLGHSVPKIFSRCPTMVAKISFKTLPPPAPPSPNYFSAATSLIRSYSGPYFPSFVLNTERYGVSLLIQFEYRKMSAKIIPNTGTFHAVNCINHGINNCSKHKKKTCKTAWYGKLKEMRETEGEWLSGSHTQIIPYPLPFNCNDTAQEKTKACKAPIDEGKGAEALKSRISDRWGT